VARKLFNFNPYDFIRKQMLPFVQEYNEYPELADKVNTIGFEFTVPMSFAEAPEKILTEVQTKSLQAVLDIEAELIKKHELILDWKSFVSPQTPVILASQFDFSQNVFYLVNKRYYLKTSGFLDSPTKKDFRLYVEQFEKEKKFDFQAYGINTEIVPQAQPQDSLYYIPRDVTKTKKDIEELMGTVYSQTWINTKVEDPQLLANFFKTYLGQEGILAGTYTGFIRPQSAKKFTIHQIDKASDKLAVKDGSGREWQRFHVKLFEQLHLYVYCMPVAEGTTCMARLMPVEDPFRLSLMEANFREHILAHFLENPSFWKPQALIEFMKSPAVQGMSSLKGIKLSKAASGYTLLLEGFKMEFHLPEEIQSVRLQTGLYQKKDEKPDWTGFGAEWVQTSATPQVCGIGVEPLGSQSIFILNFLRDSLKRLKLKDDIKPDEIPKLWTEKVTTAAGENLQMYGYCAPLRENPMEMGYYFVDFKKAKPSAMTFKVLK
jgi:hypothetical protein